MPFPDNMTLQWFQPSEFDAPEKIDKELLQFLDWVRDDSGIPLFVTSDWRSWDKNRRIGGSEYSLHPKGCAVDLTTPGSRKRDKRLFQVELWKIVVAVVFALDYEYPDRTIQLELVQGPTDWHIHLGMYPPEDTEHPNRLILAVD